MLENMNETDLELLMRYARQQSEDAFTEIVRRHLALVFRSPTTGPLAATGRGIAQCVSLSNLRGDPCA